MRNVASDDLAVIAALTHGVRGDPVAALRSQDGGWKLRNLPFG
jgi:hypothetical protein